MATLAKTYQSVCGSETARGLPKALIVAKLGGERQLEQALRDGDVVPVQEKGKTFYCFQEIAVTRTHGKHEEVAASSGVQAAGKEELSSFGAFLDNFKPSFGSLLDDSSGMPALTAGPASWHRAPAGMPASSRCVERMPLGSGAYPGNETKRNETVTP